MEDSTDSYILGMSQVLYEGNYITEKEYNQIEREVHQWQWFKKGEVLSALKHEIDMRRPWKSGKQSATHTIEEALAINEEEVKSPF